MEREYQFTPEELKILNKFNEEFPIYEMEIKKENIWFFYPQPIRIEILRIYEITDKQNELHFDCDFGYLTINKLFDRTIIGTYDLKKNRLRHRRKTTVKE